MKKQLVINRDVLDTSLPPMSEAYENRANHVLYHLTSQTEEKVVKKKLSIGLIFAIVLMIAAVTALAAYTLSRSPQADAVTRARQALSAEYGLTSETMGLFSIEWEQNDKTWIVRFYPTGTHPQPLGDYWVTLTQGKQPETSWAHDDVDPVIWKSGSLDSPVWGQPQLLQLLQNSDAAIDALSRMDLSWDSHDSFALPKLQPDSVRPRENESTWFDQIIRDAEPNPEDITKEEALALAIQAIMEESSLTQEELNAAETLVNFNERENDTPIWTFSIYVNFDGGGIAQDWGVVVDARNGEILYVNVITGGNG